MTFSLDLLGLSIIDFRWVFSCVVTNSSLDRWSSLACLLCWHGHIWVGVTGSNPQHK